MNKGNCGRRTLARSALASLELCRCGTLHLTMGVLTLRIEPAAVEALWATLGEALQELYALEQRRPARATSGDQEALPALCRTRGVS